MVFLAKNNLRIALVYTLFSHQQIAFVVVSECFAGYIA